jgi:hypothetical protein
MNKIKMGVVLTAATVLFGCASVDVTKTGKGFNDPTNANTIEILKTVPKQQYEEVGTVTAANFLLRDTATMHNEIRNKTAALGADAVILTSEGVSQNKLWAIGTAIHYKK